jgi:hypothetical protein
VTDLADLVLTITINGTNDADADSGDSRTVAAVQHRRAGAAPDRHRLSRR